MRSLGNRTRNNAAGDDDRRLPSLHVNMPPQEGNCNNTAWLMGSRLLLFGGLRLEDFLIGCQVLRRYLS